MRRVMPILLVVVVLLAGTGSGLADGMVLPLPDAGGPEGYGLAVRYHHVTVTVDDERAVTRVEQEFYNPYDRPISGRYLFPVPPEAVLSAFQAVVDGQPQVVARQDAGATNAALYGVVARQHDPSLLQYADWESLAFDLSLPPGGSRVMSLEYEQVLVPSGGLHHYRYVLSTERYSSLPLDEVSVTVDLSSSRGLSSLYSPGQAVDVERLGPGQAQVTWAVRQATPADDFDLFFAPAEGGFGAGLLTGQRNGLDHFLFFFAPEVDPGPAASLPKDMVFVLDRSGSMDGEKIEQARGALQFILGQLGSTDRFSIVSFDDGLERLSPTLQPAEGRALRDARRFVDRLSARGSTDLEAALQAALGILDRSENRGAPQIIVFLTDGLPTAGITDEATIVRQVAEANSRLEARLHVFGVGYDVNTHLLDGLAAGNGGTVTYVQPGENLELALTGFYGKIAHPLLINVSIEFEGLAVEDPYPQSLPDLFQGSGLLLTGRYGAAGDQVGNGPVSVRVRGQAGGEWREYVYHFDLAEAGGHDFVPRLWATRRVGALLDQVRVEGETPELAGEIRELGLGHGLVTPYTTFVIEGQVTGAASMANMDLYGRADLNAASGQTAVQARVQNQMYQEAAQANLAGGGNVSNYGQRSLAQVGAQQVDLSLLQGQKLDGPITDEWIAQNVKVDRTVEFGSDEYFALAADPEARASLQGAANVVFSYQGQVIAVRDTGYQAVEPPVPSLPANDGPIVSDTGQRVPPPAASVRTGILALVLGLLGRLTLGVLVVLLAGLLPAWGIAILIVGARIRRGKAA